MTILGSRKWPSWTSLFQSKAPFSIVHQCCAIYATFAKTPRSLGRKLARGNLAASHWERQNGQPVLAPGVRATAGAGAVGSVAPCGRRAQAVVHKCCPSPSLPIGWPQQLVPAALQQRLSECFQGLHGERYSWNSTVQTRMQLQRYEVMPAQTPQEGSSFVAL